MKPSVICGILKTMKKTADVLTTAYLALLFVIYPFYMKQGYVEIGKAKFFFWIHISISAAAILTLFFLIQLIRNWKENIRKIDATDFMVLLFSISLFVTYFFAVDRKEALWGTEGWNMGLITYGLLCLLYFMLQVLWIPEKIILWMALGASGVVYLLGILDRFSIHLIALEIRSPVFISTLGNINWFTGYLVVFTSVSAALFLLAKEKVSIILSGGITLLGFTAGFGQGSSSVFLFFAGLFAVLLWLSVTEKARMLRLMILWGMWCFSAQVIRLLRILIPDGYRYDTDNLCGTFTEGNLTIYLLIAGLLLLSAVLLGMKRAVGRGRWIRAGMLILTGVLAAGIAGMMIYSYLSVREGMRMPAFYERLPWGDDSFGNGRGMTYRAAMMLLTQMNPLRKLIGVGQDCFSVYAYSIPQIADELWQYFGNERLTNAHNEVLTMLVNQGLIGTLLYLGVFGTYLYRVGKKAKNPYSISIAVAVICYLVHNIVSFANVLNLPFLIILLAMGEKWCKIQ